MVTITAHFTTRPPEAHAFDGPLALEIHRARPTSSGVAGAAAFKAAGGAAARGALFLTLVVMLMTPPRTDREWAVEVISTVVTWIGGGAIAVQYCELQEWVESVIGLVTLGGLIFGGGLPGWAIVRRVFSFIEKNRDTGIDEVVQEVKEML